MDLIYISCNPSVSGGSMLPEEMVPPEAMVAAERSSVNRALGFFPGLGPLFKKLVLVVMYPNFIIQDYYLLGLEKQFIY